MPRRFIQSENARLSRCSQVRSSVGKIGILVCSTMVLGLGGCSRTQAEIHVNLPVTSVISARPRWAVAADAYVRVHAEPSAGSTIRGHLRIGDVAEIVSISTVTHDLEGIRDTWYEVDSAGLQGWAPGRSLVFYESRSRAMNAGGSIGARQGDAERLELSLEGSGEDAR